MATKFFAPTAVVAGADSASSAGKANVAAPARKKQRRFIGVEATELIVGDYMAVSVDGKVFEDGNDRWELFLWRAVRCPPLWDGNGCIDSEGFVERGPDLWS